MHRFARNLKLHLAVGPSAARTDIGPRRTPNSTFLFAVTSLGYILVFSISEPRFSFPTSGFGYRASDSGWPTLALVRTTMMLSSRAEADSTSLPTPSQNRTQKAPRGLLQRVLCGPNSFPEVRHLVLDNRMQASHWPAGTVLLHFF